MNVGWRYLLAFLPCLFDAFIWEMTYVYCRLIENVSPEKAVQLYQQAASVFEVSFAFFFLNQQINLPESKPTWMNWYLGSAVMLTKYLRLASKLFCLYYKKSVLFSFWDLTKCELYMLSSFSASCWAVQRVGNMAAVQSCSLKQFEILEGTRTVCLKFNPSNEPFITVFDILPYRHLPYITGLISLHWCSFVLQIHTEAECGTWMY